MLKRAEFIELFAGLGVTTDLSGTSALNIEKFVCFLYGDQTLNLDRFHTTIGSKMVETLQRFLLKIYIYNN